MHFEGIGSVDERRLVKLCKKLGLEVTEGTRHHLVHCIHNGQKTTIPRHGKLLKRETVRSILRWIMQMGYSEEEIRKYL